MSRGCRRRESSINGSIATSRLACGTTPSLQGGCQVLAHPDNGCGSFAGLFRKKLSAPFRRTVSGGVARCRGASRVPDMYPRCTRVLLTPGDIKCLFAGNLSSPLTDSNRRPPPYHGGSGAVRAITAGHRRARFSCKSPDPPVPLMSARDRACSTSCTRLVPALVVCSENSQRYADTYRRPTTEEAGYWSSTAPPRWRPGPRAAPVATSQSPDGPPRYSPRNIRLATAMADMAFGQPA